MTAACTSGVDTGFVTLGYAKVAWLGAVQGLSELLPISSTAHMRIVPALLGWRDPGSAFSAAMQLAALAAIVSYFWNDVSTIAIRSSIAIARKNYDDHHLKILTHIAIATLPIVLAGEMLSHILNACNSRLRDLSVLGWACIIMAILLAISEIYARHRRNLESASLFDAIVIGLAQAGALIPGVSRSGSTLTAALALGFKREEAAKFSFLLGLPAIVLSGSREIFELHQVNLSPEGWHILLCGLAVASVSAFFAIWLLMRVLEKFSSWPFIAYRVLMGLYLLALSR